MFCNNCGKEMVDTARFCPACGAPQVADEPDVVESNVNPVAEPVEEAAVPNGVLEENSVPMADEAPVEEASVDVEQQVAENPQTCCQAPPQIQMQPPYQQQSYQQPPYQQPASPAPVDNGGFGWGLLCFFFPVVGLILFLIWKDEKPKTAKAAGIGALIGVGCEIILSIIIVIIYAVLIGVLGTMYY